MGCTKRVGLFHSDRSKLQKAGTTTHNRRRASKASLPTLTKDTKKQVRGHTALFLQTLPSFTHAVLSSVLLSPLTAVTSSPPQSLSRALPLDLGVFTLSSSLTLELPALEFHPFLTSWVSSCWLCEEGLFSYLLVRLAERAAASTVSPLPFCPRGNWSTEFMKVSPRARGVHPLSSFPPIPCQELCCVLKVQGRGLTELRAQRGSLHP